MAVLKSIVTVSDVLVYLGKAGSADDAARGLLQMLIPLAEDAIRSHLGYSVTQQTYTQLYPDRDMHSNNGTEKYIDITNGRVSFRQGDSTRILQLQELPVRSITEVREDSSAYAGQGQDDFSDATVMVAGTDYYLDIDQSGFCRTGHLIRIGATWPNRGRSVQVIYVAGYTSAELDGTATEGIRAQAIRFAAIIAVAAAFNEADIQGSGNQGTGGVLASEAISTNSHAVAYDTAANRLNAGLAVDLPPKSVSLLQPFVRFRR